MSNTKENIMKVSLRLFSEKGFDAVSVSMIAGELGITKGALYRHYKSKRDILTAFLPGWREAMHLWRKATDFSQKTA